MAANSLLPNAIAPLSIPTYDGSGQCVHPDVIRVRGEFFGAEFLMAMEPYPYGREGLENPSLLSSHNGLVWREPKGLSNPLVAPPLREGAWNSDADLLPMRDGGLSLYYRYNSGQGETTLLRTASFDGLRWSAPEPLAVFPRSGRFASPAFLDLGNAYCMTYVDTIDRSVKLSLSENSVAWREEREVLRFDNAWHLDAAHLDGVVYLLLNDKKTLFLLRTSDLLSWSALYVDGWADFPARNNPPGSQRLRPIISVNPNSWDSQIIYRSSLLVEDGRLHVWYGAVTTEKEWRVGYTSGALPE